MPNILAYAMLIVWPAIAYVLFRRLPFERALVWSILGAYLLLPPGAEFDYPLVPPLDKSSIPNLTAFLIVTLVLGRKVAIFSGSPTVRLLMILFIASPIATTVLNADPLVYGPAHAPEEVPGRPLTDALAQIIRQTILLLPFFLARRHLATQTAQREILIALVVAGLAYSIPIAIEVRLSPQINVWVYGFFPHAFDQQIRFGGFRPVVFIGHGLLVAFFVLTTVAAAFGLWRAERSDGGGLFFLYGGYLTAVLVLCKSVGALVYAAVLLPLVCLADRRTQLQIAALLASVVLTYPILRGAELIPVEAMIERAEAINEERAESLAFRLRSEGRVLRHAQERPIFGWGGGGRNSLVFDPDRGYGAAVTDGRWVIVISMFGWCGYIVEFGLLALPLLLLAWRTRRTPSAKLSPYVGPLALILGFNVFDLLPNSPLTPFTWLLAGALLGYAESMARTPARTRKPIETIL